MLNFCIVEDDAVHMNHLKECLARFCSENGYEYKIDGFGDGLDFLSSYKPIYDAVFLDIQLPNIDGMETARRLRLTDAIVPVIFVTNLLKYAIHGYQVGAFDYIVKPIDYFDFSVRMKKFLLRLPKNDRKIVLTFGNTMQCVSVRDIIYVEVTGHNIRYRMVGEDISVHGSLSAAAQELPPEMFCKCNNGTIVNLNFVQTVVKDSVSVAGEWLPISRHKKKEFVSAVTRFIAGK